MITILVVCLIAIGVLFAIRSIRKTKGCGSGCGNCAHSASCPAKSIQQMLDEKKKA